MLGVCWANIGNAQQISTRKTAKPTLVLNINPPHSSLSCSLAAPQIQKENLVRNIGSPVSLLAVDGHERDRLEPVGLGGRARESSTANLTPANPGFRASTWDIGNGREKTTTNGNRFWLRQCRRQRLRLTVHRECERLSHTGVGETGGRVESTISSLIGGAERGEASAAEALFAALYSELHQLAKRELARHGVPEGLGATTLLHQAYLDMAAREGPSFPDRARFMGYSARVMRGLIIDHARNRQAQKRGGQFEITSLGTDVGENAADDRELTRISEALDELAKMDAALAEVVDLKFFCGFSFAEIAAMRSVSERTVQRHWEKARIYLHGSIRPDLSL